MADQWVARTASDFAQAIESELPRGAAWSRDPDGGLMQWVSGCAQIWGEVSAKATQLLLIESDPRQTVDMLTDWEDAFGLPDPCVQRTLTVQQRRAALMNRIQIEGGASKTFFIELAATLGYQITITEYSLFQAGMSFTGSTPVMLPSSRYYWTVNVQAPALTYFHTGVSQAAVDPLLSITKADDLECVINRWKPAHTIVLFNYIPASA